MSHPKKTNIMKLYIKHRLEIAIWIIALSTLAEFLLLLLRGG